MKLAVELVVESVYNKISAASHSSLLDIIETAGPCRYVVQEKFALVPDGPQFSAPKTIAQSRSKHCPDATDYSDACAPAYTDVVLQPRSCVVAAISHEDGVNYVMSDTIFFVPAPPPNIMPTTVARLADFLAVIMDPKSSATENASSYMLSQLLFDNHPFFQHRSLFGLSISQVLVPHCVEGFVN